MADWYEVVRVSIFDDNQYFDVHQIDIGEHMDYRCGGSMLSSVRKSGKVKTYVPISHEPDFDAEGKVIVASNNEEILQNDIVKKVKRYTKDGVRVNRYITK